MKKLFAIAVIGLLIFSCSAQNHNEERILEIAKSELYAQYKENLYFSSYLIATNSVDLQAISLLMDKYPQFNYLSEYDRSLFAQVRGGLVWYDNKIEFSKLYAQLDSLYHFSEFSVEEYKVISKLYEELTNQEGKRKLREAAFDHLLKSKN